jgi:predicted nucleic acid-binding protein
VSRGLQTLDALQLAVALDMLGTSWISAMLSADKRLCDVAEACGCPAVDPAKRGLIEG